MINLNLAYQALLEENISIHTTTTATTTYLSLHVYGCNDREEGITADAKNYDLEFDRISRTTGGSFFLPEKEIYDFEKGPRPTDAVLLHYANLLLMYYDRQPMTEKIAMLQKNILSKLESRILKNNQQANGLTFHPDSFVS